MAHSIGCIGSSTDQRTKRAPMTRAQRTANQSLVPRRTRNQNRSIAFIEVVRGGQVSKVKAIKDGQLQHYRTAYCFADEVRYVTDRDTGRKIVVKRK